MARRNRAESDGWSDYSDEDPEDRWETTTQNGRWPVADTDEDRWDSAASRRRTGRLRVEVPPIVNPYAIVALVAALLGLFPVAVVFGLISFSHPRGRMMAMSALLLGLAEAVAVAAVVLVLGFGTATGPFEDLPGALGQTGSTVTHTTTVTEADDSESAVSTTTGVPSTTSTRADTEPIAAIEGESCTRSDAAMIGEASDGSVLLCLHTTEGYRWSGPYSVSTAVFTEGATCDPALDKTARTPEGRALVCEKQGGTHAWTPWIE